MPRQTNFGGTPSSLHDSGASPSQADVPEPANAMPVAAAAVISLGWRRR